MSLLKIAKLGNPILRQSLEKVSKKELTSELIQKLIDDMVETMRDSGGVAIAAPQVHVLKQIITIEVSTDKLDRPQIPLTILVNPQIVTPSEETEEDWEGCLSVSDFRARVPRSLSLTIKGLDRKGNNIEMEVSGYFARIIQHEVDHLNGIIYLDRVTDHSTLTHQKEYEKYWKK